ncbi:MAG TPA: permease-like cell division protein FtsX [Candidatus Dormibacteraeota bacterium]|jgi:cell division transport system permease protein|nr:permease-like cell division protein FtsX [Candidatus Dormibacteraeota bacterium]
MRPLFMPRRVVISNAFSLVVMDAARNWLRHLPFFVPALGSMGVALLMGGATATAAWIATEVLHAEATQASVIHVYIRDDASAAQTDALTSRLKSRAGVLSVVFVSKDQALAQASTRPGLKDLAASAGTNPFPASLDIRASNLSVLSSLDTLARHDPAVDSAYPTSYDAGAYSRVANVLGYGIGGALLLVLMLAVVAIAVTTGGIRAAILTRRDEIRVMRLVGSRPWMIKGPFLVEGALTGLAAGLAAALILVPATIALVSASQHSLVPLAPGLSPLTALQVGWLVPAAGMLLGMLASSIGLKKLPA